jgi:hypothetical protein
VIIIPILGVAAGVILGLRHFKILALLPVILLVVAAAVADGVAARLHPRTTALVLLAFVVSPQIGYLIGSIAVSYIVRRRSSDQEEGGGAPPHANEIGQEQIATFLNYCRNRRENWPPLLARMNHREVRASGTANRDRAKKIAVQQA